MDALTKELGSALVELLGVAEADPRDFPLHQFEACRQEALAKARVALAKLVPLIRAEKAAA